MKRTILSLILLSIISLPVFAENIPNLGIKTIKNKDSVSYNTETGIWSNKTDKKNGNYYTKAKGFGAYSDYLYPNQDFAFTTDCEHEFLFEGKLIGHSNKDLNFYEIGLENGKVVKQLMDKEAVQTMLPDYRVISLSEFSDKTNSLKVKKKFGDLKIVIINDKELVLPDYEFASGNAKFEQYEMSGVIKVEKSGMIQFSGKDGNTESTPWFILLVR